MDVTTFLLLKMYQISQGVSQPATVQISTPIWKAAPPWCIIRPPRCTGDGAGRRRPSSHRRRQSKDGHLILRTKHHGETHFKIVQLRKLAELTGDTNERDGHG